MLKKRLAKEFSELAKNPPAGLKLLTTSADAPVWQVELIGAEGSVYAGESYVLLIKFSETKYPFESPEVVFDITPPHVAPMHPHIYSNGHICLDILGEAWYVDWLLASAITSPYCYSLLAGRPRLG